MYGLQQYDAMKKKQKMELDWRVNIYKYLMESRERKFKEGGFQSGMISGLHMGNMSYLLYTIITVDKQFLRLFQMRTLSAAEQQTNGGVTHRVRH